MRISQGREGSVEGGFLAYFRVYLLNYDACSRAVST